MQQDPTPKNMEPVHKNAPEWLPWVKWGGATVAALIVAMYALSALWNTYRIWQVEMKGKALLIEKEYEGLAIKAKADNERLAKVAAAKAEDEAAQYTANAIRQVGQAAKEFPEYRQQEFYTALGESLQSGNNQIIYLPTEALLPITESGRAAK